MRISRGRAAGVVNTILCDAIGILVFGLFIPGVTLNWRGFLIAVAIIALPSEAIGLYLDSTAGKDTGRPPQAGRFAIGFLGALLWVIVSPAIADWVTPDFNIGGPWQYLLLVAILFLVAMAVWRIIELGKRLIEGRA